MKIDILTLFPEMFPPVLNKSIIGRACEKDIVSLNYTDIRDFSHNKHNKVDDYSYGGGMGMVMKPEPIYSAIESVKTEKSKVIYLSPKGRVYNQDIALELSREEHLIFLCGHYEGIDNRIVEHFIDDEISIGDYVLTGGEIGAMVLTDSIVRLLPGALSDEESYKIESHYEGLLEYPQYTRPCVFKEISVPEVLLSGDHKKIENWRLYQSLKVTYMNRPDLLEKRDLSKTEKQMIEDIKKELKD